MCDTTPQDQSGTKKWRSPRWWERCTMFALFFSSTFASVSFRQITVTAFLEGSTHPVCRRPHKLAATRINDKTRRHIRPPPSSPLFRTPRAFALLAKKNDDSGEDDNEDEKESSRFSLSGFFSRDSSDNDDTIQRKTKDSDKSSSSIPLIGRFFSKGDNKDGEDEEDIEKSPSRIRSVVSQYVQTRRLRKDAEALQEEVMRREEAKRIRIKEQQKAVAEARKRVQNSTGRVQKESRQAEVKREVEKLRKIEAQKVVDLQRLERLEKLRLERELRQQGIPPGEADKVTFPVSTAALRQSNPPSSPNSPIKPVSDSKRQNNKMDDKKGKKDDDTSSSSGSGFNVVSVAQKFVNGLFKEEEWIVVAPKTRISPGELVPVTVAGIDLLLVASKDGSALHCIANSCPHLGTPLEIGTLERRPIESSPLSSPNLDGTTTTTTPSPDGQSGGVPFFQENDISRMLREDGCEECIVCPLHRTAFALESGEVRGEWCPYPPVIGKLTGAMKKESNLPVFDVRTRGKNIEVRLNTPVVIDSDKQQKKKNRKEK